MSKPAKKAHTDNHTSSKKDKNESELAHKASSVSGKTGKVFPFTAIVGQDEMKLCLLLNVIDPRIGGVLVMGHRGTGKSTTVRALADVLPMIERAERDVFNRTVEEVMQKKHTG